MAQHYRVVLYDGDQEWIDKQVDRSIHGVKQVGANTITVADVSSEDARSISFFRNIVRQLEATVLDDDAPLQR